MATMISKTKRIHIHKEKKSDFFQDAKAALFFYLGFRQKIF